MCFRSYHQVRLCIHDVFLHSIGLKCAPPPDPANGRVSITGTIYGQTATYSCNTGYDLVGNSTRVCQATGVWSGSAPTCQGTLLLSSTKYQVRYVYMMYSSFQQLWTVALCLTQSMGKLTPLEQHMDRQPPTVVMQATDWWETVLALVKLQECGLGVHLHVKVHCY